MNPPAVDSNHRLHRGVCLCGRRQDPLDPAAPSAEVVLRPQLSPVGGDRSTPRTPFFPVQKSFYSATAEPAEMHCMHEGLYGGGLRPLRGHIKPQTRPPGP